MYVDVSFDVCKKTRPSIAHTVEFFPQSYPRKQTKAPLSPLDKKRHCDLVSHGLENAIH